MKTTIFLMLLIFQALMPLKPENLPAQSSNEAPKEVCIFWDCSICDEQYFKENLTLVSFSNDSKTAHIHILVTLQPTGSGGSEVLMRFVGQHFFEGMNFELSCQIMPDQTEHELRELLLNTIKLGLIPFLSKTIYSQNIVVIYQEHSKPDTSVATDPWRNWIFYSTFSGSAATEKTYSIVNITSLFSSSRVTHESKLLIDANFYYSETTNKFYDGNELLSTYHSIWRDFAISGLYVKRLGNHFGIGGLAGVRNKSFNNLRFQMQLSPAFEYSVFQYNKASRQQLCLLYSIGYEYSEYEKLTIHNRMNDKLLKHCFKIGFGIRETFGSLAAGFSGSGYLNDFTKTDYSIFAYANIKVARGIAIQGSLNLTRPRTEISLAAGKNSLENFITKQSEQETDIRLSFGVGCSFRFGSKNSNIVNPGFSFF